MKTIDTIKVENKAIMPHYNAFQGGYGSHDKGKKAKHKADRKADKQLCKKYF